MISKPSVACCMLSCDLLCVRVVRPRWRLALDLPLWAPRFMLQLSTEIGAPSSNSSQVAHEQSASETYNMFIDYLIGGALWFYEHGIRYVVMCCFIYFNKEVSLDKVHLQKCQIRWLVAASSWNFGFCIDKPLQSRCLSSRRLEPSIC